MSSRRESLKLANDAEKQVDPPVEPASFGDHLRGRQFSVDAADLSIVTADQNKLHRNLKGRHMQMIAM
jgi:yeast amino acid transporter